MTQFNQYHYQTQQSGGAIGQTVSIGTSPLTAKGLAEIQQSRISLLGDYSERLAPRLAHMHGLNDRLQRVADRVFGPVPEQAGAVGAINGSTCQAALLNDGLADLDRIIARLEQLVDRVEGV